MPEFSFKADTSFDEFAKINAALKDPVVAHDIHADDPDGFNDQDDDNPGDEDVGTPDR